MHKAIQEAIQSAVRETGQPEQTARQLMTWLEALTDGSETLEDQEKVSQRCEFLYQSIVLAEEDDE